MIVSLSPEVSLGLLGFDRRPPIFVRVRSTDAVLAGTVTGSELILATIILPIEQIVATVPLLVRVLVAGKAEQTPVRANDVREPASDSVC